jgi:hypothetical protein
VTGHCPWQAKELKILLVWMPGSPFIAAFFFIFFLNRISLYKAGFGYKPAHHVKDILHYLCYISSRTVSITPFQMLHFAMVLRCWDQQLPEGWGCRKREPSSTPCRVTDSMRRTAASQALAGGGHATAVTIASVGAGMRGGLGGA